MGPSFLNLCYKIVSTIQTESFFWAEMSHSYVFLLYLAQWDCSFLVVPLFKK